MGTKVTDGISLAKFVQSSPSLHRMLRPVARAFARAAGHRQVGLKYDDLIIEESPELQKALSRLAPREAYDRAFRLRQASQLNVQRRELPKEQWMSETEDQRYLTPLINEVQEEAAERAAWDTVKVSKK